MTITIIGALVVLAFIGKLWWGLREVKAKLQTRVEAGAMVEALIVFSKELENFITKTVEDLDVQAFEQAIKPIVKTRGRPKKAVKRVKNND